MRDDQVMRLHASSVKREMLLLEQFEFLSTRQVAMEEILFNRKMLLKAILNPTWAKRVIDNRQIELLTKAKQQREAAKNKTIIKPVLAGGNGHA